MIDARSVIRRRVVAQGRVQGVFFRDTCRREARGRRVSGWVTNREDGTVEAVFEGDPAAVQALVDWARHGPPQAQVIKLDVMTEEPRGERGFSVR
jgi:acylphosphatase